MKNKEGWVAVSERAHNRTGVFLLQNEPTLLLFFNSLGLIRPVVNHAGLPMFWARTSISTKAVETECWSCFVPSESA